MRAYFQTVGLFLSRYRIGSNMHKSATCGVESAENEKVDDEVDTRDVALKGMHNQDQFERELLRRAWRHQYGTWTRPRDDDPAALDPRFVVGILAEHSDAEMRAAVRV